jgi:predicted MFS family arabinose efflux permease
MATAPLAMSTAAIGWRASFLAVGAFTLLVGLLIAAVIRDDARPRSRHEDWHESLSGIFAVMRTPSMGRLFVMNLAAYSTFGLIVGLWGGPYLTHIYGYGLEERGVFLLVAVLTQIVGSMLWGPMDRVAGNHKLPVLLGAGTSAAALGALALVGALGPSMLVLWFAVFGFVTAYVPLLIAHGRALFPLHLVGRGLTALNMASMGGTFLVQAVSGFVIELFPTASDGAYALAAYRLVFALQAGFILLACLVYFGSGEPIQGRQGTQGSGASA